MNNRFKWLRLDSKHFAISRAALGGVMMLQAIASNAPAIDGNPSPQKQQPSWSQFLGINRNGISTEIGLIESLDEKGPAEVWRQPMVGGLSGIAIANDRLLTLSQSDGKQWLVALEVASGKQLWKTSVGEAYQNPMGNGPRSTPTIDEDMAFVYTGEGILASASLADGRIAWSKNLPKEMNGRPSEYGMSCSPLVYQSTVVVHVGGSGGDRKSVV